MVTKSGKHHWKGTLIHLNSKGEESSRIEDYRFTAKDPYKFIETLRGRFPTPKRLEHEWKTTRIENLVDLDA